MFEFSAKNRLYKSVEGTYDKGGSRITVYACRNTYAAFQILIKSDSSFALCVGNRQYMPQKLSKKVLRVCGEGLNIGIEKYQTAEDGRRIADAVLETDAAEFETTAALFVTIPVCSDSAERISGRVELFEHTALDDEKAIGSICYEVIVSDHVMKDASELRLHLDLWQHASSVARLHGVPLWSDRHFKMLEPYIASLAYLGQKCITLVVTDMPWGGQSCYDHLGCKADLFEYSIVGVRKTAYGFEYDFTAMQRYIDLCFKYGIKSEIELIGLIGVWSNGSKTFDTSVSGRPDRLRIRYTDTDGSAKYMKKADDIDGYVRAIEKYFSDSGLISIVRVCADEPADAEEYRKSLVHLRSVAKSFRFKSAINHAEFIGEFGDAIDDFVPYIDCLAREHIRIKQYRGAMPDKRFLWYVCCGPSYPNTFIRSPLRETLFIGAFTSFASLDGFLRWSYCLYTDEPLREQNYHIFPAGDMGFVYPSPDGGVTKTLRYHTLRLAAELYELLEEAKEKGIDVCRYYDEIITEQDISNYRYGVLKADGFMINDDDRLLRLIYELAEELS